MPFDSKIAASLCGAQDLAVEALESCEGAAPPGDAVAEPPRRGGISLYNLIKAVAKMEDVEAGKAKLMEAALKSEEGLDRKNSKGSTALHACAYLKRWDLAQVLLDAGASPSVKNAAGQTFFLYAVKDSAAPWRDLFAAHPDLVEKHQKHLDRSRAKDPARPAPKPTEPKSPSAMPSAEVDRSSIRGVALDEAKAKITSLLNQAEAIELSQVQAVPNAFACIDAGLLGPLLNALSAVDRARVLTEPELPAPQGRELIKRLMAEDDPAVFGAWIGARGRFGPVDGGGAYLSSLLAQQRHEDIKRAASNGFEASEDFIEDCEERGLYELADFLIDHNSENRPLPPLASAPASRGVKSTKPGKKNVSANGKGKSGGAAEKKRPVPKRARGPKSSNRAAKIANLDGPLKEANEYEYQEKKAPAKATIVIVKKARPLLRMEGDPAAS